MVQTIKPDICVLGAGAAGLSIAAGAAQMGAQTVLLEPGKMGGDCLNYGCVPSKALLVAAKAAKIDAFATRLGVRYPRPEIDFQAVHDHVHQVIAAIAPQDSVERFEGLGVRVIPARGRFLGPREVEAGEFRIRARRFVVATGSRPFVPPIPGLETTAYLTNETVFDLTERPEHLIVIGGGPIGCELGQAFRLLGSRVTILEMATILPKDDPELVDILRTRLRGDGVEILEGTKAVEIGVAGQGVEVTLEHDGARQTIAGTALLVAAGRSAVVEGLGLEAAGIAYDGAGLKVDSRLRTTNKRVFAAGDVSGDYQFTHMAGYHAGIVLKNALFRLPAKVDRRAVPWVTYTDPELAHVGLTEETARRTQGHIRILRWPFSENDRAQAERKTDGVIKVTATPAGKVLGASILGPQAGELIQIWVLAVSQGIKMSALAGMIAPYPTLGEVGKRAAGSFYTARLFDARTKWLVRLLSRLG